MHEALETMSMSDVSLSSLTGGSRYDNLLRIALEVREGLFFGSEDSSYNRDAEAQRHKQRGF